MRYAALLIICSFFIIGCDEASKPDAFLCSFIKMDPIEESYAYCYNSRTKEEKEILVSDLDGYVMASADDYEKIRDHYKQKCKASSGNFIIR